MAEATSALRVVGHLELIALLLVPALLPPRGGERPSDARLHGEPAAFSLALPSRSPRRAVLPDWLLPRMLLTLREPVAARARWRSRIANVLGWTKTEWPYLRIRTSVPIQIVSTRVRSGLVRRSRSPSMKA